MLGRLHKPCHSCFDNLFGNHLETSFVVLIIAVIDAEVKPVRAIDLNVEESRTARTKSEHFRHMISEMARAPQDISVQIDHFCRPLSSSVECLLPAEFIQTCPMH